jgi:hypothetical protein
MKRIMGLALLVTTACRFTGIPLRVEGSPAALGAIAGSWQGEYWSSYSDRRGTISFSLKAGTDSAFGDVMMETPFGEALLAADRGDRHMMHAQAPRVLHIDFVRVEGRAVRGALEPYVSPDCSCVASTVFDGFVIADTLRGVFHTTLAGGAQREGQWRMLRRAEDTP